MVTSASSCLCHRSNLQVECGACSSLSWPKDSIGRMLNSVLWTNISSCLKMIWHYAMFNCKYTEYCSQSILLNYCEVGIVQSKFLSNWLCDSRIFCNFEWCNMKFEKAFVSWHLPCDILNWFYYCYSIIWSLYHPSAIWIGLWKRKYGDYLSSNVNWWMSRKDKWREFVGCRNNVI